MIQTLGDVFLLVAIICVGMVSFLLGVLLYHLIFVVMDLRQVMRRVNGLTQQVEEMIVKPVEIVSQILEWLQIHVLEAYFGEEKPKRKKHRKKEKVSEGEETGEVL